MSADFKDMLYCRDIVQDILEEDLEGCEIHLDVWARVCPTDFVVFLFQPAQVKQMELIKVAIDVNLQYEDA